MSEPTRLDHFQTHLAAAGQDPAHPDRFVESQPPYRFIDRVLVRDDTHTRVLKNVTRNEWCLVCSEAEGYRLPWSILLECMAQTAGTYDEYLQKRVPPARILLTRIKHVELKRSPEPGDQLFITARLLKVFSNNAMYEVEAHIGEDLAASCKIFFARV
jgi:3-hydroxymyristoyl/3-hydroxydecanoyl-(acyl carrier protein) dehydratase